MRRRGWAAIFTIVGALGAVFGNHLPVSWLDDHPRWTIAGFAALTLIFAAMAAIPDRSNDTSDSSATTITASGPEAVAVTGDHNTTLGAGAVAIGEVVLSSPPEPAEPQPPPRVDLCLGRSTEIDKIVSTWMLGRSVVALGPPGIGKSTVLGRAITDPRTAAAFGSRRFVVPCDGAASAQAAVDKIAQVLGVPIGEHLINRVISFLFTAPSVLVLDNFESVTDDDPGGRTSW